MEAKAKQPWTEEETLCFLTLWSSSAVQDQLDGASRTKPVFKQIQRDMAIAGFYRTLDQLINKLKKLKKEYRDQKRQLERNGRTKRTPHFELLDSVLGARPVGQTAGLNPATAATDLRLLVVDEFMVRTSANNPDLLSVKKEEDSEVPQLLTCNSPTPSCSTSSTSSSFRQTKSGKRKRDSTTELIEYLERSEKRFLQQTRRDQALTAALLQNVQTMDETTKTLVGLMERMVSVMESQSQK